MLQTLSMKDFPDQTFDDIGHVIIDECHRIPSRVFSKALLKINCNYMLGLSATPNRKDGLTKVLKWHIGDIIYSVKSSEKNVVKVDRYLFDSSDETYNKEVLSFRGQVQMATMVNNITFYHKRTLVVMKRVIEEVKANDSRQFLILSDRKQHLEDMYKIAIENDITSVGYYVGGMKETALKETESKNIVVATYSMAAEALDIKTLSTLVMVTPKTDIVQSVGRILRMKHDNPIIVDIVDSHDVFKNQWKQRKTFYRKSNYRIYTIASTDYTDMVESFQQKPCKWKKAFEPKAGKKEEDDPPDEPSVPMIGKCMINIGNLVSAT